MIHPDCMRLKAYNFLGLGDMPNAFLSSVLTICRQCKRNIKERTGITWKELMN